MELAAALEQAWRRSDGIFALFASGLYHKRPIPLRNPLFFYEGHLPAFAYIQICRGVLGAPALHERFDALFARGIDPADEAAVPDLGALASRDEVRQYRNLVRARLREVLATADVSPSAPERLMKGGQIFHLVLEHELMHHETLMYMLPELEAVNKRPPPASAEPEAGPAGDSEHTVHVPAGQAVLGAARGSLPFGWDNEFERTVVDVPAFTIDACPVSNAGFLEFLRAGGYQQQRLWSDEGWAWVQRGPRERPHRWLPAAGGFRLRDTFEVIDLPPSWPAQVTHAEASAYARWRGARLPSEAEWQRAAYGDGEGPYPWGAAPPTEAHGNFGFRHRSRTPVGSFPAGRSRWGVLDLLGNGWEWTSTAFGPLPGFAVEPAYPVYSADFFDGKHYVMKGGGPFTDPSLLRPSFRNWFFWDYPYVDSAFRCVT